MRGTGREGRGEKGAEEIGATATRARSPGLRTLPGPRSAAAAGTADSAPGSAGPDLPCRAVPSPSHLQHHPIPIPNIIITPSPSCPIPVPIPIIIPIPS